MKDLIIPQIKLEEEIRQIKPVTAPDPTTKGIMINKFINRIRLKRKKTWVTIAGIVTLIFLILLVILVLPAIRVYNEANLLRADATDLQVAVDSQDISKIKAEIFDIKTHLVAFQGAYKSLGWIRFIPLLGVYWKDGDAAVNAGLQGLEAGEILIATVEPYADIIGFSGGSVQASSGEESANDRIEFLIQTIQEIAPKMDVISQKAQKAHEELTKIDPSRYPEEFRGIKVKQKLTEVLDMAEQGTKMLADSKPLIEQAPYLLGIDGTRTYLLLFQNDKELRPTGGFITAYSIVKVTKGKLQPVSSSDIYSLDARYTKIIQAPDPLALYLKGPYTLSKTLFLRDMNWEPDFRTSMELFYSEAKKAGMIEVDGIIAVDTQVVVNILDALGEIGVPGFGNFSTKVEPKCDCPQVIYALEDYADVEGPVVWSENTGEIVFAPKNYGKNRKEIVGPLMNSVLSNALGQPKEKLPDLFEAAWNSAIEKHVLVYMTDEKSQTAVEKFNMAGRISEFEGDYLHINDANLGGRKSNLYVTQEVHQSYEVGESGDIEKTVEVTYKNPKAYDGWLNSVLPNWTRIYVPKGSELISMEGFEDKYDPYEEFGKTVFTGGFLVRPQGVSKITVKYKLPFKANKNLSLLIQKQPGTGSPLYITTMGKKEDEFFLTTDKEIRLGL
ncbi:MAG: hypothetical protein US96_C0008G0019 [Candidatus Woesebacteria bacterium GW2011_GWB1_38_5b]|uniref:DUF4012 domain-containing protein n=1 Tax=Candidatus Woesebacteria bacterium GW2011_GWB1_38_5b TaxID=1618569 RepID=A0A0G0K7L1_9BACT|nr:MAG: hypothetical protein US96_C0008G0019 [Candidatus Woesebacteria bacterium GW2011_GWB1_38_5b]